MAASGYWPAVVGEALDVGLQRWWTRGVPPLAEAGLGAPGAPGGPFAAGGGRTAVVTGPTSGIGRFTALELVRRGWHVVLACRSVARGEAVLEGILAELAGAEGLGTAEVLALDVSDLASVAAFARALNARKRPLPLLINNAGLFNMGQARTCNGAGREIHMATNHLGPALLTLLLLPSLRRAGDGDRRRSWSPFKRATPAGAVAPGSRSRVVNVSSKLHEACRLDMADPEQAAGRFSNKEAYGRSKLAGILFTRELRRRLGGEGIGCYSVHPGNIVTNIARSLPAAVQFLYKTFVQALLLRPDEGARATIYVATGAAVEEEAAVSDGYFTSSCKAILPSKAALDDALALVVWEWTLADGQLGALIPQSVLKTLDDDDDS